MPLSKLLRYKRIISSITALSTCESTNHRSEDARIKLSFSVKNLPIPRTHMNTPNLSPMTDLHEIQW